MSYTLEVDMVKILLAAFYVIVGLCYDKAVQSIQKKWTNPFTSFLLKSKNVVLLGVAVVIIIIA